MDLPIAINEYIDDAPALHAFGWRHIPAENACEPGLEGDGFRLTQGYT
jgi:hypothetical protein